MNFPSRTFKYLTSFQKIGQLRDIIGILYSSSFTQEPLKNVKHIHDLFLIEIIIQQLSHLTYECLMKYYYAILLPINNIIICLLIYQTVNPRQKMNSIPFDLVVARSANFGIGLKGKLPWNLPPDLKMFKKITCSGPNKNTVIMGRKTFDSIGKALPNRLNIIVSKNTLIKEDVNLKQARSLQEALKLSTQINSKGKNYVIGGSKLFEDGISKCHHIYQTFIANQLPADVYMPKHNLLCKYVSKTKRFENLIYDYRLYENTNETKNMSQAQNLFNEPEHQQYQYLRMIKTIIQKGDTKNDRTGTGTKSIFGGMMRYDLSDTFPLLTHKKVFLRGVVEELLWFISGSTNAKYLEAKNIHIWDGNSSKQYLKSIGINREAGDLGPVYGFQWRHWNAQYKTFHENYEGKGVDQLKWIIDQIKKNPNSRRLILSAWNPAQLSQMALPPCHLLCQFQVTNDKKLNCLMYQRSCDMGLGVPFNIASYSLLTCLIAQVTGLKRGEFIHTLGDMHVYNDHIQPLQDIDKLVPHPFPVLTLNPEIKDIDSFSYKDITVTGYKSHPKISMKMSV